VSVTEIVPRNGDFERTPPLDVAAEQCVLGGMLLSKDAISDVLEVIRPTDHYRPAHQLVHEAILDLYGRGEPADAITVANELTRRNEIARVGGAPYLHTLIASVPTAANAGYYARIVRERAILRRLVEAGTRIVQFGYAGDAEADDLVDRAQAEVFAITERRAGEDYHSLSEIMPAALDEIEAIGSRGGGLTGVPTGFADLDVLTNGLHSGQMVVIAARPAMGKALALDTPLPTPDGWTTMGQVRVGDQLLGADGKPTRVLAATDVMHGRPCYELEFDDGTTIVADAKHQWKTTTRAARRQRSETSTAWYWMKESRLRLRAAYQAAIAEPDRCITASELLATVGSEFKNIMHTAGRGIGLASERVSITAMGPARSYTWRAPAYASRHALLAAMVHLADRPKNAAITAMHEDVVTTVQIADTLHHPTDGRLNHAVAVAKPADLPTKDLPLPPYVLGVWLGDGTSRSATFTSADPQVALEIEAVGMRVVKSAAAPLRYTIWLADDHRTAQATLRSMEVLGNKHIPSEYLRASLEQRRALLAGLLDTDGTVNRTGSVQFTVTSWRLASDVRELVLSLGYRCGWSERRVPGATVSSSVAYTITFTTTDDVFRLDRKRITHRQRRPERTTPRTRQRFVAAVRPVDSVPVRCVQVDNDDHMYLASESMIPTHNSTLALDFARAAAIRSQMSTVFFSLEMGRNEITMRLLSAEARVPLQTMRTGQMNDDDWARLARRMSEVADAPLFIDDSPNMSMMEIRAKCRRLKQRNDLKFVIVDYLQLMSSPKRVENRQQEVSEMSRSLKLLAKELDVPVVALSQLNRGPEQRTDKKPLLSDLRESGCLTGDTTLLRADTGAPVTFAELMRDGWDGALLWSLDEQHKLVPAPVTNVFESGIKDVYLLQLASGREVKATANHPFLTLSSWTPLENLSIGDRLAIPRHAPEPISVGLGWSEHELELLAQGIENLPSYQKHIPAALYSASNQEIAVFLRHLWATDGNVTVPRTKTAAKVYYASSSRALADGVALLLSRFGIVARIRKVTKPGYRPSFHVIVADSPSLRTFCREIGVHGARGKLVPELSAFLDGRAVNTLREIASSDIYWDRVLSIEPLGLQPVYDATVKGTHNFIADGIAAHNSIEQDSDLVILLHREDAYEKESPRAGEADLIVAKHRNGPTATVTVAFQGHYSRFVDMAHS
jgi:replicative DNA helicase